MNDQDANCNRIIPFNRAFIAGRELQYIAEAVANGELKGDGPFTRKCSEWIESYFGIEKALITPSCTSALEMAAILLDLQVGDEVIMPSYTFTSTANAFLLRGAKPVFVDIRPDTLNIDESKIEEKITKATKAICPVHYAGVSCDMDSIMEIAARHNLYVIEDAAHAIMAKYRGASLGSIGHMATYSFHETKNYNCGEGGALLINDSSFIKRAEIIREKGTNRSQFFRGQVDKYSWIDIGSSFLPSEIISAFLYGQLECAEKINEERLSVWNSYYRKLEPLANRGVARLPVVPDECAHNAHLFYLLMNSEEEQIRLLSYLNSKGVFAVFHYIPLHTAPMGQQLGYAHGDFPLSESIAHRIVRLPLFCGITGEEIQYIVDHVEQFFVGNTNLP